MSTSQKMSIRDKIKAIIDDPTASDLLRFICAKSLNRDVLDAVYDLELAADLFAQLLCRPAHQGRVDAMTIEDANTLIPTLAALRGEILDLRI